MAKYMIDDWAEGAVFPTPRAALLGALAFDDGTATAYVYSTFAAKGGGFIVGLSGVNAQHVGYLSRFPIDLVPDAGRDLDRSEFPTWETAVDALVTYLKGGFAEHTTDAIKIEPRLEVALDDDEGPHGPPSVVGYTVRMGGYVLERVS